MKFTILFLIAGVYLADVLATKVVIPKCKRRNEIYQSSSNCCEFTCEDYQYAGACAPGCDPSRRKCYCKPQTYRHKNGDCVTEDKCNSVPAVQPVPAPKVVEPQQPPCNRPNESFKTDGFLCTNTCATKGRVFKCAEGFQSGCFCYDGYLRNSQNICVPIAQCD